MGADFRRFRIGSYSNDFAARGDATRTRGSPAVPHWGFFQFLCRARRRDAGARVSGGSALGFLPVPLPREVARRRRAGLRRFRVSGFEELCRAKRRERAGLQRFRVSGFEELCRAKRRERAGLRRFRVGDSSGSFGARSEAVSRPQGHSSSFTNSAMRARPRVILSREVA